MPGFYDPLSIRNSMRRVGVSGKTAANNGGVGGNTTAVSSPDAENKKKWLDFVKGIDRRLAEAEYNKVHPEYRESQKKAGLNPERDLELLERKPTFWGSVKAGVEDAALNLAEMGATMASKIPSPLKNTAENTKQIVAYRRQLLKDYIAAADLEHAITPFGKKGLNPGRAISFTGEAVPSFLNPAGKLKLANALYHMTLPVAKSDPINRAPVAAASNIAGESIESALSPLLRKIPFLGKINGLPGNIFGQGIETTANRLEERFSDYIREKKK